MNGQYREIVAFTTRQACLATGIVGMGGAVLLFGPSLLGWSTLVRAVAGAFGAPNLICAITVAVFLWRTRREDGGA